MSFLSSEPRLVGAGFESNVIFILYHQLKYYYRLCLCHSLVRSVRSSAHFFPGQQLCIQLYIIHLHTITLS